jgi:hypothetical protein
VSNQATVRITKKRPSGRELQRLSLQRGVIVPEQQKQNSKTEIQLAVK